MFLFSGRGYWQELIESILSHNKLKVAPAIQPRALSITQGRAVGVAHYLLGGIATTWAFFLARICRLIQQYLFFLPLSSILLFLWGIGACVAHTPYTPQRF
jgi:hypothetical protein